MTKELENIPYPTEEIGDDLRSPKRSSKSSINIVPENAEREKHCLSPKDEMISFLRTLYGASPQGCLALWSLSDKKTQWFEANELALIAETALQLAAQDDVYFGLGLQRECLTENQRGTAKDVIAIPGLWIDIDVKDPAHKGLAYPPTKEDALKTVAVFPLQPTVIVDSGHGFHVWWLFKRLWVFGTEGDRQRAQRLSTDFQQTLQEIAARQGWTIDSTQDLSRILRLPGTWNRKREPVRVHVTEIHKTARYDPEELAKYLLLKKPKQSTRNRTGTIYEGERNTTLTSFAGGMRRRGATEEEMREELLKINADRCDPPLDETEIRTIARSVSRYPSEQEIEYEKYFKLTDTGNAKRLVSAYGQDIHYCYPWKKWLIWDSVRWIQDTTGEMERRAKKTARLIYSEIEKARGEELRKALSSWAARSESRTKITAMISLAKSEPGIAVNPEDWDSSPWLLNVNNGTIDLKTGKLLPHRRKDLCTKLALVDYDPEAKCPTWDRFLDRVFGGDKDLISYMQRVVGYSLTGSTKEQVLIVLHGIGANGKSTFIEVISSMLGDYAIHMEFETLSLSRQGAIRNDIARLAGARLVTSQEAEMGQKVAESLIKNLTGSDTVTARFLYGEAFDFSPQFKLFLATNHKPVINGRDHAIWRRIHLVPFKVVIPAEEQDKDLSAKLRQELPGILAWAVRGCLEWQVKGLSQPSAVTEATREYREEMDTLERFIRECCIVREDAEIASSDLYAAYKKWAVENQVQALSQRALAPRLRERGFKQARNAKKRIWKGIDLNHDDVMSDYDAISQHSQYDTCDSESTKNKCHMRHFVGGGAAPMPNNTGIASRDAYSKLVTQLGEAAAQQGAAARMRGSGRVGGLALDEEL